MEINIYAVVLSAALYFILGALWYSKLLFSDIWAEAMDFSNEARDGHRPPVIGLFLSFIGALLTSFALAHMTALADTSILSHITFALMAWLGFIAASQMGAVYFNYHDKKSPAKIFWINSGYNLVGFVLIAIILALFK